MDCTGKSFCHELSIKINMLSAIKERGRSASGMNQTHVSGVIIIILFLFFSLSLLLFLLPSVSFSLSVGTRSTGQRSQIGLNRAFLHQSCARWASSIFLSAEVMSSTLPNKCGDMISVVTFSEFVCC